MPKDTRQKSSSIISKSLDIEQILTIAKEAPGIGSPIKPITHKKPAVTIAVALDTSFNFYYHDNLEALRHHGANLEFFSPTKDKKIPDCDGMYIGGGFPEVLSDSLEKNQLMKKR